MPKLGRRSPAEPSPDRARVSLTWVLAVGVIVVAVLAAVIAIAVVRGERAPEASSSPAASVPPTAAATVATPGASPTPCASATQASGGPILAAPETTWSFVDSLAVPTTAGGPKVINGPLATCYTPDTLGALTAAAQIYLRANVDPGGDVVRERQTTPDSDLQTQEAKEAWTRNPPQKPWLQLHGFRTGSITDNRVDVALQLKDADGRTTPTLTFAMSWTGTDWRLGPGSVGSGGDTSLVTWEGV